MSTTIAPSPTLSAGLSSAVATDATATGRILLVEDDAALRELLIEVLSGAGHRVTAVANGAEALARLPQAGTTPPAFDMILTDLIMPGLGGEAVLSGARERAPNVPVIVMTAFGSIESAVRIVRSGAFDYVTKPVGTAELLQSVSRAVAASRRRSLDPIIGTSEAPVPSESLRARVFGSLIAESDSMKSLLGLVEKVSPSSHPVLLTGESGTGKEVMAHAIHALSQRGPFIVVNCGAIPEQLIESELFGHERGAFTGADRERPGLVAAADGGTLFLDEVGELPLALQPALLRFLESGEARRVGATASRHYDVRVIAATHRDLEGEMAAGRFREDLYWRLNVLPLEVAPLRSRVDDVLPLARKFLTESGGTHALDASTEGLLTTYAWPGNVRELRNAMHRAATFSVSDTVMPDDLPPRLREANRAAALVAHASQQLLPLRALERAYVLDIVRRTDGNKSRAAEILGLDRKTLYRKLAEYAQEPGDEGELT